MFAVDGMWGEWSEWSKCTKSCKFGTQSRNRKCNNPAPTHDGKDCEGPAEQSRKCNANVPCPGKKTFTLKTKLKRYIRQLFLRLKINEVTFFNKDNA